MSENTEPPIKHVSTTVQNTSGGVDVAADTVSIGGNVVGRDSIQQTTTNVTNVGLSPQAVQKLIITVAIVVFVTAACFFASGIFVGTRVLTALNQKVDSNPAAAAEFQQFLAELAALPAGSPVDFTFNVNQLSGYVRHILGPEIGLTNGRVRVLENGEFVFYGSYAGAGGRPIVAVTTIDPSGGPLFKLQRASLQLISLPTGDPDTVSPLFWVPIANDVVQPLIDEVNRRIGASLQVTRPPDVSVPDEGGQDSSGGQVSLPGDTK